MFKELIDQKDIIDLGKAKKAKNSILQIVEDLKDTICISDFKHERPCDSHCLITFSMPKGRVKFEYLGEYCSVEVNGLSAPNVKEALGFKIFTEKEYYDFADRYIPDKIFLDIFSVICFRCFT